MLVLVAVWGFAIFAVLILISFGTYSILVYSKTNKKRKIGSSLAISLCNCFACGVFLSTCFLGLIPHLRNHELHIRAATSTKLLPSSELIVLIGFSLILLIEQAVHGLQHRNAVGTERSAAPKKGKGCKTVLESPVDAIGSTHPLLSLRADGETEPLVSDISSGDDSLDASPSAPRVEFHRIDHEHSLEMHGGHSHAAFRSKQLSFSVFALLLGLSSHSIFEGVALGVQRDQSDFYNFLIAIMVHELLCSFAFGVSLAQHETPPKVALVSVLILSTSIPFGMSSSFVVNSLDTFNALLCRFVLESLAAGAFIYVSCVEMLSAELGAHGRGGLACISKAIAVIVGIIVFFLLNLTFGHHA